MYLYIQNTGSTPYAVRSLVRINALKIVETRSTFEAQRCSFGASLKDEAVK